MGMKITAAVSCDNCNGPDTQMQSPDAPLPVSWGRVQGYANISGGDSQTLDGYFCPVCISALGTRALVKKAADISEDLTTAASGV